MMRTRRITKPAFPIPGVKVCDECERPKKIKRNHAGKSYCDACYKRGFTHMPCAGCGEACVAKRGTVVPYCQACETAHRLCKGCGRHVPHAGMYHEGAVVCPSCVPKYKAKAPCPDCGKLTSRLSRIGGEGEAICDRCRNKHDHATCGTCGRYRKQANEEAGKPICIECLEGTTHICPDCQQDVPGGGTSRCRDCAARARGRVAVASHLDGFSQGWVREIFLAHCAADLLRQPRGDVVRRVAGAAAFFTAVDANIANPSAMSAEALLGIFGPERLRRASTAARFIVTFMKIPWPDHTGEEFAERARIDAMLKEIADQSWAPDISAFLDHLRSPERTRALRPQTIRMYLRAAIALMEQSDLQSAAEVEDGDVMRFLRRTRGHANSLAAFTSWIGTPSVSSTPKRREPKSRETRLLQEGRAIVAALQMANTRSEALALLAASIAKLHGVPLQRVLRLRADQVSGGEPMRISVDDTAMVLGAPLAAAMARWNRALGDTLVFESSRTGRAMSASGVAHHVKLARCRQS
ncbi:hypothetical protein ACFPOB_11425 [Bosea eneae]|uniref:Uncharacterized protein n=1 Tax=Bosea eneae TaxID=151454 RepID=A0ABW0ITF6_9HYPH